jgi:hypothetical protein
VQGDYEKGYQVFPLVPVRWVLLAARWLKSIRPAYNKQPFKIKAMKPIIMFFFLAIFLSCNSDQNSNYPPNSYENTKMTLEDQEKENPLAFLRAKGTYRKNLIDQWVFEGSVTSSATVATYKDVVLRIVYYSKTDTEMGSEDKTVFEYFKPGASQEFKIKTNGYKKAEKIGFEIVSAMAIQ